MRVTAYMHIAWIFFLSMIDGCATWMLTKRTEKKLGGNYTRMLRAVLNKFWKQHPTKQMLNSKLDEQDMQDTTGEVKTNS